MANVFTRGVKRLFGIKEKRKPVEVCGSCYEVREDSALDVKDKSLDVASEPVKNVIGKKVAKKKIVKKKAVPKKSSVKRVSKKKTSVKKK
jgi:hypothetical protein